jgi:hypothetical protein
MFARRAEIILVIGALWVCCYADAADVHTIDVNANATGMNASGVHATGVNATDVNATGRIHAMYKQRRMGDERSKRRSVSGIVDAHGDSINVSREVKTKVVLMEDVLAARSAASGASTGGHFAPADQQQQQRRNKAKKITLNV